MNLARCILAGVVSLIVGGVLLIVCLAVALNLRSGGGNSTISVDVTAWARSPYAWMVALLLFGLGFWVESWRGK